MVEVWIVFKTGDANLFAAPDLEVNASLVYSSGVELGWIPLYKQTRGKLNIYRIEAETCDISSILLRVKHDDTQLSVKKDYDTWYLSWVALISPDPNCGDILFYRYDDWISVAQGNPNWLDVDLGTPEKSIPKEVLAKIAAEILAS